MNQNWHERVSNYVEELEQIAIAIDATIKQTSVDTGAVNASEVERSMQGMVESLNVSVAAALLLFEAQRQRLAAGIYAERRIPDEDYERLRFEWLHPSLAKRYRDRGEPYPAVDEDGDIVPPERPTVDQ